MANTKLLTKLRGSNPRDTKDFIVRLKALGLEVTPGGKHWIVLRDGRKVASFPTTPSCSRSVLNTVSDFRKIGIDLRSMSLS